MSKALIFVLEDNPTELDTMKMYLDEFSDSDDGILMASSGEEAIRVIQSAEPKPGIFILDLNMPGRIQGIEVLIEMQKYPELNTCAKIILTSSTNPRDKAECLKYGATEFKTKPKLLKDTKACIKGILKKYKDYKPSGPSTKNEHANRYTELSQEFGDLFDAD